MNILDNRRVVYQAIFINPEDVATLIERQGEKLPREVKNSIVMLGIGLFCIGIYLLNDKKE